MAKILIITSVASGKKQDFVDLVRKNFKNPDTEIDIVEIPYISLEFDQHELQLFVKDKLITEYDLVYFRGIKLGDFLYAPSVALCIKYLGIKFFDSMYANIGPNKSKITSLIQLATAHVPIAKTLYLYKDTSKKTFEYISSRLGTPFVAKELSMQRGKGVFLIYNQTDLDNMPQKSESGSDNDYLFQEYIEKDHEYRLLVLGNSIGVWEEKIATVEGEFRNNVALGAEEIFLDESKTPDDIAKVSIQASQVLGLEVAGVDIMTEKESGKVYVIEVNRGPGLTYDETVSPEFKQIAKFLEQEASNV